MNDNEPLRSLIADDVPDLRELAAATEPDCVLLDLAMPIMDGVQAIPKLRRVAAEDGEFAVRSGFADTTIACIALELGAALCLDKATALTELPATQRRTRAGRLKLPVERAATASPVEAD